MSEVRAHYHSCLFPTVTILNILNILNFKLLPLLSLVRLIKAQSLSLSALGKVPEPITVYLDNLVLSYIDRQIISG